MTRPRGAPPGGEPLKTHRVETREASLHNVRFYQNISDAPPPPPINKSDFYFFNVHRRRGNKHQDGNGAGRTCGNAPVLLVLAAKAGGVGGGQTPGGKLYSTYSCFSYANLSYRFLRDDSKAR